MEQIEIWAGFGLVGDTEKKNLANYEQLFRSGFLLLLNFGTFWPQVAVHKYQISPS